VSYVEIEIRAKTVDLAVEAAMQELGVENREQLAVEVVSEPERGFLGIGGKDAIVKVKRQDPRRQQRDRSRGRSDRQRSSESGRQEKSQTTRNSGSRSGRRPNGGSDRGKQSKGKPVSGQEKSRKDDRPTLSVEEQADQARQFLEGLVDAYGLEGSVETRIDDDVIVIDVNGEQTEALVGVRGSVRSALHELTRTVLQKYSQDTGRIRLDVAGYAERRRQALTIYADQLIDQLTAEGGEIMLEPMSSSDRKVIHDAAAARGRVESYSEGEAPRRYVVLAAAADVAADAGGEEE
jgi:spoIIIJ-associated protein